MKKVTFSFFAIVFVCVVFMFFAVMLSNQIRYLAIAEEKNETCFQLGVGMTEVMKSNGSIVVDSCNCFFSAFEDEGLVTECVCDCVIPGIPYTSCGMLEGCYVENFQCRCLYGIIIES